MTAGGRVRDVFPLPLLSESPLKKTSLSRGTERRVLQRRAIAGRVNKAILALNSLFFGGKRRESCIKVDDLHSLPLIQQDALKHIHKLVKQLGSPPPDACSQGAMNALRAAGSSYDEPLPDVGTVVDMELSKLSLPSGKVASVSLCDNLSGDIRTMVEDIESHLLQDASLWTDIEFEDWSSSFAYPTMSHLRRTPWWQSWRVWASHCMSIQVGASVSEWWSLGRATYMAVGMSAGVIGGRDANGVFWTLRAQPYPLPLAKTFASLAATTLRGSGSGL